MERLALLCMAIISAVGCAMFTGALLGAALADSARGREAVHVWIIAGLCGMVTGLLAMIIHLRLPRRVAADERPFWTSLLWWGGPFVATVYLFRKARGRVETTLRG